MKNLLLILAFTVMAGVTFSQSKKEQIEILTNRVDSLNTNVSNLQSLLKIKTDSLALVNAELKKYNNANQIVNIPDANFKAYLVGNTKINTSGDKEIQLSEASAFKDTIYCNGLKISNLKGIEAFTALTGLFCHNNQLTFHLDLSKNTALDYLNCDYNPLTSLDLSKNTALTKLSCGSNKLTSLDVSKNVALTYLNCEWNKLTSLDVSQNNALTSLDCGYNEIIWLDVSKNNALTYLDCYGNGNKFDCYALKRKYGID